MDELGQFSSQSYLNLETYKRSGQAVRTPLWFVEDRGVLYMRTPAASAKVRRIRNNPRVRLVPSDWRGNPIGVWVEGEAHLIEASQAEWINQMIKRKYGLMKRLIDLLARLRKIVPIVIGVRL